MFAIYSSAEVIRKISRNDKVLCQCKIADWSNDTIHLSETIHQKTAHFRDWEVYYKQLKLFVSLKSPKDSWDFISHLQSV